MSGSGSERVSVRLDERQAAALRTYAEQQGTTLSDLLRDGARQMVDPTRTVAASVDEELPYRFDRGGNLTAGARYDFSTDLIAGSKGDGEALRRATEFMRAAFDTDRADVAALNPARHRPDMYVDRLPFQSLIWNTIREGTLEDATPFVIPKFNSSSGLVADHTEGVEPDPGGYTATAQTVTPTPVSGRVEITREAWDQGGSPGLSGLIWRQMVQAWFEGLEAEAVSLLDGLSPAQITLPVAAQDDTLVDALVDALVPLLFVRGGFSMRMMVTQIDLYRALVTAADSTGRRLLPVVGATNAVGQAQPLYTSLDLNGVTVAPSWALAGSGSVPASSYLFNPENVHGWATNPQRLQFEYRVAYVDLAIWGYKAVACTDLAGVREVVYDPA